VKPVSRAERRRMMKARVETAAVAPRQSRLDALGMVEIAIALGPQPAPQMRSHLNQVLSAAGIGVWDRGKLFRAVDPEGDAAGDTEARRQALMTALVESRDKLKARVG
jgi:hypothetical protein